MRERVADMARRIAAASRVGIRHQRGSMLGRQASALLIIGALLAFWMVLVAHV